MITVDFENYPTLAVEDATYAEIDHQGYLHIYKDSKSTQPLAVVAQSRWMHYTLTPPADTPDESSTYD